MEHIENDDVPGTTATMVYLLGGVNHGQLARL